MIQTVWPRELFFFLFLSFSIKKKSTRWREQARKGYAAS